MFAQDYTIIALTAARRAELFPQLWLAHAVLLECGSELVRTIAAFRVDDSSGKLYAADVGRNIAPILLSDGREAYRALWVQSILDLLPLNGVSVLTAAELDQLTPNPADT